MGSRETGTGRQSRNRTVTAPREYKDYGEFATAVVRDAAIALAARMNPITDDERDALDTYQGSSYTNINTLLRKGTLGENKQATEEAARRNAERLASAIDKQSVPEDLIVYRGWKVADNLHEMFRNGTLEGAKIDDKGFMSTSLEADKSRGAFTYSSNSALFRLRLNKGTKAIVPADVWEREVLVQRGSAVRVISAKLNAQGNLEIEGEIVQ